MNQNPTLRRGDLAYVDTLHSGLVPCKIVRIDTDTRQDGKTVAHVVARITGKRDAYHVGEVISSESPGTIIPRTAIRKFRGQIFQRVLPFTVIRDDQEVK